MTPAGARPPTPQTRMQYPDEYWCVADDGPAQYFWAEQTVSREEYLANSGKDDCA